MLPAILASEGYFKRWEISILRQKFPCPCLMSVFIFTTFLVFVYEKSCLLFIHKTLIPKANHHSTEMSQSHLLHMVVMKYENQGKQGEKGEHENKQEHSVSDNPG